jgi:uncharacterized membrane protein
MGTNEWDGNLPRRRIESIDAVRGLAMVLMALDHVRLFFYTGTLVYSPVNLDETTTAAFLTRWITHLCAPAFVFLAGMGAYLRAQKEPSRIATARYLGLRGLWLIVLELTVVHWCWYFNLHYEEVDGGILWMIGCTMIALGGLIFLPRPAIGLIAAVLIVVQHAWQSMPDDAWGRWAWLWSILYAPDTLEPFPGVDFDPVYPLLPWIGVLAAGWCCGPWALLPGEARRRRFVSAGSLLLAVFFLLRALNAYGDPRPWTAERSDWFTVLSFVNCTKYPPSLLFLLMTLGATLLLLGWLDRPPGAVQTKLMVFGRTPLFYYLLHLFVIHALAVAFSMIRYGAATWLFECPPWNKKHAADYPPGYGYSLPVTYLIWALVVAVLYPCCLWFQRVRRHTWLGRLF